MKKELMGKAMGLFHKYQMQELENRDEDWFADGYLTTAWSFPAGYTEDLETTGCRYGSEHNITFNTVQVYVNMALNQFINICTVGDETVVVTEVYSDEDMLENLRYMKFDELVYDAADACFDAMLDSENPSIHKIGNVTYQTIYLIKNENG